ncbi:MAG: SURF1 family protein [Rudaea sp.]
MAFFVALGVWQLRRRQEKIAQLDAVAATLAQRKPLPLVRTAWNESRKDTYDWVVGTGAFVSRPPILLDNQIRDGRVGVQVYRIFGMEKPDWSMGGSILVDFGWLPLPENRVLPDLHFPVSNRITVSGLLSPPPASGFSLGQVATLHQNAWLATRIDLDALAPKVLEWVPAWKPKLAPRVLRLDPSLPMGFARDLVVLPNTLPPSRHLGYAVQWFGFALVALIIFIGKHWRKAETIDNE